MEKNTDMGRKCKSDTQIDLGLVIALSEEFGEVIDCFSKLIDNFEYFPVQLSSPTRYYYRFTIPGPNYGYECVAVLTGGMGPERSTRSAELMQSDYQPKTVVSIGIAGALESSLNLGDVVVGTEIDAYHIEGKISQSNDQLVFEKAGESFKTTQSYTVHCKDLRFVSPKIYEEWVMDSDACLVQYPELVASESPEVKKSLSESTKVVLGPIASGPVVAASELFGEWLLGNNRKYKAVEMESSGIGISIEGRETDFLVIRGISDFADSRKKSLDTTTKGLARTACMHNAVRFLNTLCKLGRIEQCDISQDNIRTEEQRVTVQYHVVFEGHVDEFDSETLTKFLLDMREYGLDMKLKINTVGEGSVVLSIESSESSYDRFRTLVEEGDLFEIADFPIIAIGRIDGNDESLSPPDKVEEESRVSSREIQRIGQQAKTSFDAGNFELATRLYTRAVFHLISMYGVTTNEVIENVANLAQSLRRLNRVNQAIELLETAIDLHNHHPETSALSLTGLTLQNNLTEMLNASEKPGSAFYKCINILSETSNQSLPAELDITILITKNNLAEACRLLGRPAVAARIHNEVLEERLELLHSRHPHVTVSKWNLLLCSISMCSLMRAEALKAELAWLKGASQSSLSFEQRDVLEKLIRLDQTKLEAAHNSAHPFGEVISTVSQQNSCIKSTTCFPNSLKKKEDPIPPVVYRLDSTFRLRMTPEETRCFIKEIEYRFDEGLYPILVPEGSLDTDPSSAPRIDNTDILRLNKKRSKTLKTAMYGLPYLLKLAKTWGLCDEEQKTELVHNWSELLRSPDTYINQGGKASVVGQVEVYCDEPYYSVRVSITDDYLQEMENGRDFFASLALTRASVFDLPVSVRLFALPVVVIELARYQANQALEKNYQKLLHAKWYVAKP